MQIVFATILERVFFHVVPSVLSVVGTLTIITCALYVAVSTQCYNFWTTAYFLNLKLTKDASSTPENDKTTITLRDMNEDSLESGLLEHDNEGEASSKRPGQ